MRRLLPQPGLPWALLTAACLGSMATLYAVLPAEQPPSAEEAPSQTPLDAGRGLDVRDGAGTTYLIIGDVHGCVEPLRRLVGEHRRPGERLVFVGDFIAKGAESEAVVQAMVEWGALAVMGNNDAKVLEYVTLEGGGRALDALPWAFDGGLRQPENHRTPNTYSTTAATLSPSSVAYLLRLPLYIRLPLVRNTVIVHAGVEPGKSPATTSNYNLLNMRSWVHGRPSVGVDPDVPWAPQWTGPEFVVFGHDARRGLQETSHAIGLDSGCVYGKTLTGLHWPSGEKVSVAC